MAGLGKFADTIRVTTGRPTPQKSKAAARSSNRTVLLVDDDDDFRVAVAEALGDDAHQVIEARSGEAALSVLEHAARAREHGPDLIVLDLMMPRMGGIEFLQRLRKSPRWAQVAVLIVTAVNDPMLRVRLDVPIAFKSDTDAVLQMIRRYLA